MSNAEVLRRIVDAIPQGINVIDRNGIIIEVNRAFLIHFGRTRDDILGRPLKQVMNSMIYFNGKSQKDDPWELENPAALEVLRTHLPASASFNQGQATAAARPVLDKDGEIFYVVTTYMPQKQNAAAARKPERPQAARERLLGSCAQIAELHELLRLAAETDATVLITGETGTGKEVAADELHILSRRSGGPFVKVNCAAIPDTLMEAELFGYEKGSFTGALKNGKAGLMESADGGTLLLDEIGEMPLSMQAKLLRAIQEKTVTRVGGVTPIPVDIRLVATTNRDLRKEVEEGRFRADLYYRLNVIPAEMPPLRERGGDIRLIGEYFLREFSEKYRREGAFTEEAWALLLDYEWPGNTRQLRNIMERAVVLSRGEPTSADTVRGWLGLPSAAPGPVRPEEKSEITLQEATDRLQASMLRAAMEKYRNTYRAAEALGISQSTLVRKAKALGITAGEDETSA